MNIKRYIDVVKSSEVLKNIEDILSNRLWSIQSSYTGSSINFFMSVLDHTEIVFFDRLFRDLVKDYTKENNINEFEFERAYINCHPCQHPGDWHVDGKSGFTLLYYPVSATDFGLEGATDFKDFEIQYYIGNSVLIFPANTDHMATEHRHPGILRYSIAFKFKT
jgi:hypothetical protein